MPDDGVGSWPLRRSRINGASVAFRQGDRSVTYTELAARVDRLAAALTLLGVTKGSRVAYLAANDIAGFETFFAAGRLGAVFVPLNTRLTEPEVAALLLDCRPAVLVHGSPPPPPTAGLPTLRTIAIEELSDLPVGNSTGTSGSSPDDPDGHADVALTDDAVILYTSGTTGVAKGAVLTHGNLTFNTMNQLAHVDVLSTDVALCISPLFHATGLGQVSLPTLFKGGTVVVVPKFEPAAVLSAIERWQVTCFSAVPTTLQMLCDHPAFDAADLSSLRYVIYGGSMVAERVAVAWQARGVELHQGYGMTEASPGVYMAVGEGARERPVSIGVPHFFTDVAFDPVRSDSPASAAPAVVDPAVGPTDPAAGVVRHSGELLVRGPNVFRGYWNRPVETAGAFTDGWFRSGDVVRVMADGWAYVVDRVKDMIITGGENVYPAEVEAVLDTLPGVVESAVVACPDPQWGEVGYAYLVTTGVTWDRDSVRTALQGRLASFKIPRHVQLVAELPRTATGKIRKQQLARGLGSPPAGDTAGPAPAG